MTQIVTNHVDDIAPAVLEAARKVSVEEADGHCPAEIAAIKGEIAIALDATQCGAGDPWPFRLESGKAALVAARSERSIAIATQRLAPSATAVADRAMRELDRSQRAEQLGFQPDTRERDDEQAQAVADIGFLRRMRGIPNTEEA